MLQKNQLISAVTTTCIYFAFTILTNVSSASSIPQQSLPVGGPNSNMSFDPNNVTFSSRDNEQAFPGCLVAIRTKESGHARTYLLSRNLYPSIDTCTFSPGTNLFPDSILRPAVSDLGIDCSVLIFSPLIPQELTQHTSPGFCIVWRLRNPRPVPVTVSVLVSWQPPVSDAHVSTSVLNSENGEFGVSMQHSGYSSVLACAPERSNQTVSEAAWNTSTAVPDWYSMFREHGEFSSTSLGSSNNASAVCVKLVLKPGENTDIPFAIVWSDKGAGDSRRAQTVETSSERLLEEWLPLHILTDEWQHKIQFSNLPDSLQNQTISSVENLFTSYRTNSKGFHVHKNTSGSQNAYSVFLSYPLLEFFAPGSAENMAKNETDPVVQSYMLLEQCMWAGDKDLLAHTISQTVQAVTGISGTDPEMKWLAIHALLNCLQYLSSSSNVDSLKAQLNQALSALPLLAMPLSPSGTWIANRLGIPIPATNMPALSITSPTPADILEMLSVNPQQGIDAVMSASQQPTATAQTGLNGAAYWNIPITMTGLHLDIPNQSAAIFPSIPGEWRVLDCPIFAPTFVGRIHYAPGIHGPEIELNIDTVLPLSTGAAISHLFSHTAAFSLKTLSIPGPLLVTDSASSTFNVFISLNHHPLAYKFKLMPNKTVQIQFSAPVPLSTGDMLEIREQ